MHTYRLAVGSRRYRQLPTENRRSSVGVYWTPTRSSGLIGAIPPIRNLNRRKSQSALVGRCVPNVNPIVGANRQVCIEFRLDSTVGGKLTNHSYHFRARLDLAAIFASTGIDYFTHFRHFCFVVSIQPRLKHHSTSFQMQKLPLATYIIAFYGSMQQTFTLITQRSLFLGLSDNKLISRSKEITSHWSAIKGI